MPYLRLLAVGVVAWLVAGFVDFLLGLVARVRWTRLLTLVRRTCRRPFAAVAVTVAVRAAVQPSHVPAESAWRHTLGVLVVAAVAWLVVKVAFVAEDVTFARVRIDITDNRRARRQRTQVRLLRRIIAAAVVTVAVATALLSLPGLKGAGASLLASAGFLSVVAGLAAQTTLGNVFAGLQLTFTDAMRLDDVIVVEDEWGRVEEITLTYVVLALWDERRLVLPTSWFTSHPFQNWTRIESRVLGEVVLHLDYAVPVGALREQAQAIVEQSPLWDRRDWVLQVVDSTPSTMVVRVLASAADAPSSYDLRCEIREKLLGWVQAEHPQGLPHLRVTTTGDQLYDPYPTSQDADVRAPGRSAFS